MVDTKQLSFIFADISGNPASMKTYIPATSSYDPAGTVATDIQPLSDISLVGVQESQDHAIAEPTAANALDATHPYASFRLRLTTIWQSLNPRSHISLGIPGPKLSVGVGDDDRIDPSNATFDALKAAAAAVGLMDSEGNLLDTTTLGGLEKGHLINTKARVF